jgi:hypothetical protein
MRINNPRQLAASLYQHIYPRSNFQNMSTTGQREWIDGVEVFRKAILEDVRKRFSRCTLHANQSFDSFIDFLENDEQVIQ